MNILSLVTRDFGVRFVQMNASVTQNQFFCSLIVFCLFQVEISLFIEERSVLTLQNNFATANAYKQSEADVRTVVRFFKKVTRNCKRFCPKIFLKLDLLNDNTFETKH
jgi:hypothetical protein